METIYSDPIGTSTHFTPTANCQFKIIMECSNSSSSTCSINDQSMIEDKELNSCNSTVQICAPTSSLHVQASGMHNCD